MIRYYKILVALLSIGALVFFFLFTEEKVENQTDILYWKSNFNKIKYIPPKKENSDFSNYIPKELTLQRLDYSFKEIPLYTIQTSESLYEGGFNVKNLFTELSVIRTKMQEATTPELEKRFGIDKANSPRLEFYTDTKLEKVFYIGKQSKDGQSIYISDGSNIVKLIYFIIERFQKTETAFREKMMLHTDGEFYTKILWTHAEPLELNNKIQKINNVDREEWFKKKESLLRVDPKKSSELTQSLMGLNVSIFPDEMGTDGYKIIDSITSGNPTHTLDLYLRSGLEYKISFYPKLNVKEKDYFPIKREIVGKLQETKSLLLKQDWERIENLLKEIQLAPEWKAPSERQNTNKDKK